MKNTSPNIAEARDSGLPLAWLLPALGLMVALGVLHLAEASSDVLLAALVFSAGAGCSVILASLHQRAALGWASQVTLARLALVAALAAALLEPSLYASAGWWLTGLALLALALDGLDGWLARRLGESSTFGARFDMEVDAALIMILSLAVVFASDIGPWVLLLGAMRYGFVLSAVVWPWLGAPLPPSLRRKLVCVWQVCALILAIVPLFGLTTQQIVLLTALAGLIYSFAADVRWLWSNQSGPHSEQVMT